MKYLLTIGLLFCSGCAPIPHFATLVPHVSGTVTINNVPAGGVKVLITSKHNENMCSPPGTGSITDAAGHFELEEIREFRFFTTMGDRIGGNRLCIIKDGNTYLGYSDGGRSYIPNSIKLKCNINMDSRIISNNYSQSDEYRDAVCKTVE